MPSEVLVDADGYVLTDADGYVIDQSCITPCCGPTPPCPTPCGRRWMMCLRKWRATRLRTVRILQPGFGAVEDSRLYSEHSMRPQDDGLDGPWRLDPVDPASDGIDGPCQFVVSGLIPTRRILEVTNPRDTGCLGPFAPFRDESRQCEQITGYCTDPESQGTDPAPGSEPFQPIAAGLSPIPLPLAWVGIGQAFGRSGVIVGTGCDVSGGDGSDPPSQWGSVQRTVRCILGTPGNPTGECVSTAQIVNSASWRYGRSGVSHYRQLYHATQTGQTPVVCRDGLGASVNVGCGALTAEDRIEVEAEWVVALLEDNEGNMFPGCGGFIPNECIGTRYWLEGRACGRAGGGGRGRVFLPFENVRTCGTVPMGEVDEQGRQACYEFDKRYGVHASLPEGAHVGNTIVDQNSPKTCCECGTAQGRCSGTDLRATLGPDGEQRPAWVSWRRNAGGVLERVGGINVGGLCCCGPGDIITVNFVESDIDVPLLSLDEEWRLRPGRGLGASFRRDQRWPVGDPANGGGDPTFGQFISDITRANGPSGQQAWGQALNDPPMACEWGPLMGAYFDFDRWHDCVGTWNNAQGQQFGRLAAPQDPDRDQFVNRWRLMEWTVGGITCGLFSATARYEHELGGQLINRIRLTITRPATPGDPCGGGCSDAGSGGGLSALITQLRGSITGGGCSDCGKDGRL